MQTANTNERRIVILLGPPGSGKGTQAARLAKSLGLMALSTGEILRRESDSGSSVGETVRSLLADGRLVGNDLMNQIVQARMVAAECAPGCILDGYPRTLEQARFLDRLLQAEETPEPLVFDFVVTPEIVIERLSQRRQCPSCGGIYGAEFDVYGKDLLCDLDRTPLVRRNDDNPKAIRERLDIYRRNTHELVSFYQARNYQVVDAMQPPDAIAGELLARMAVKPTVPAYSQR